MSIPAQPAESPVRLVSILKLKVVAPGASENGELHCLVPRDTLNVLHSYRFQLCFEFVSY